MEHRSWEGLFWERVKLYFYMNQHGISLASWMGLVTLSFPIHIERDIRSERATPSLAVPDLKAYQ